MEEREQKSGRRRGVIAAVLSAAAMAVALPVAGAFAAGDSGDAAPGTSGADNVPVQAQEQPAPENDSTPRDRDCPEKAGSGGSSSDASVQL